MGLALTRFLVPYSKYSYHSHLSVEPMAKKTPPAVRDSSSVAQSALAWFYQRREESPDVINFVWKFVCLRSELGNKP
jgi:hypothetical protein